MRSFSTCLTLRRRGVDSSRPWTPPAFANARRKKETGSNRHGEPDGFQGHCAMRSEGVRSRVGRHGTVCFTSPFRLPFFLLRACVLLPPCLLSLAALSFGGGQESGEQRGHTASDTQAQGTRRKGTRAPLATADSRCCSRVARLRLRLGSARLGSALCRGRRGVRMCAVPVAPYCACAELRYAFHPL
jgi:hypothetical protein